MNCVGNHKYCDPHVGLHFASAASLLVAATAHPRLTYVLELAGNRLAGDTIVPVLIRALDHPSAVVREGAIAGLTKHASREDVRAAVRALLARETSKVLREVATEFLEAS